MINLIVIFFGVFLMTVSSHASDYIPLPPTDLASTQFSLLTVNDGEALYTRFGHTMVRIRQPSNEVDFVVDWGQFDFSDPWFFPKFFWGDLNYKMGFAPSKVAIRHYQAVEHRGIIEDDFFLTLPQKQRLMEKINWNMQQENLLYKYQYFRKNCATIPRDYLNYALGEEFENTFQDPVVPTITYRDYVRKNLGISSYVAFALDIIFNSDTDQPMSRWDEMFYPKKLREHLSHLTAFDDFGKPIAGQSLLINNRILVDLPEPEGQAIDGYYVALLLAGIPLLVVTISMFFRSLAGKMTSLKWHNRIFGLVSLWWGVTVGFFGLVHLLYWAFSYHSDFFHNLNILLFWPIDIIVLIPAVMLGIRGQDFGHNIWFQRRYWRTFATIHLGFIPFYAIVACSGFFEQNTSRVVIFMVPLSLLYYIVMVRLTWRADSCIESTGVIETK